MLPKNLIVMSVEENPINFNSLTNVAYSVFHGPSFANDNSRLKENVFLEWYGFWSKHFESVGSSFQLFSDEFMRATYVTVLHQNHSPIAMHFYSEWDLENQVHLKSRYWSQYPQKAKDDLKSLGLSHVLSMEYFYIHADWRFQKTALPLSEVLAGLGMNIFLENKKLNGVVSIARKAVKSQDRGASWGLEPICDLELHNNPCCVVACSRDGFHENSNFNVRLLTKYFWDRRSYIGFTSRDNSVESFSEKVA